MSQAEKYPYRSVNIFLTTISFSRVNKIPPAIELPTEIGIHFLEPGFPRIQVGMKISSLNSDLVTFNLEVVGLFDYIGQKKEYDEPLNTEFVEQRALHMLWVFSSQVVKLVSGQAGMNPLQIREPSSFPPLQPTQVIADKPNARQVKPRTSKSPA